MTVLTDMATLNVLASSGNFLELPVGDDPRVARFSSAHDAEVTRRILLGWGCCHRVMDEECLPIVEGGEDIDRSRTRVPTE
jgi:hypothetical protein